MILPPESEDKRKQNIQAEEEFAEREAFEAFLTGRATGGGAATLSPVPAGVELAVPLSSSPESSLSYSSRLRISGESLTVLILMRPGTAESSSPSPSKRRPRSEISNFSDLELLKMGSIVSSGLAVALSAVASSSGVRF